MGEVHTIHNYISNDVDDDGNPIKVLRKGAVSAHKGQSLLIPINSAEGALLCVGKGNPDWNWSAPHGAGRRLSRSQAKEELTMEDYKSDMAGIYTTTVCLSTLDECPRAYKSLDDILPYIEPTVEVLKHIRPVYAFKNAIKEECEDLS